MLSVVATRRAYRSTTSHVRVQRDAYSKSRWIRAVIELHVRAADE
ncbi:Hypothetical protein A7982_03248 [Minicystis rosea]|nr:Hypothetical protein A7982_03248 [Minicystis rosea]